MCLVQPSQISRFAKISGIVQKRLEDLEHWRTSVQVCFCSSLLQISQWPWISCIGNSLSEMLLRRGREMIVLLRKSNVYQPPVSPENPNWNFSMLANARCFKCWVPLHLQAFLGRRGIYTHLEQSRTPTLTMTPFFLVILNAKNADQCATVADPTTADGRALRQDPLEAILVIFGRRALIFFFVWKLLEKNEKWRHFCAHAQWWSPWRRKNVEKGHLAPSNLTFLIIAIDTNGFRRMKEEGLIYKTLPQIF